MFSWTVVTFKLCDYHAAFILCLLLSSLALSSTCASVSGCCCSVKGDMMVSVTFAISA